MIMRKTSIKRALVGCLISAVVSGAVFATASLATCGGGGGGGVGGMVGQKTYNTPWVTLRSTDPAPKGSMILYWFPADIADYDTSTLRSSRLLSVLGARCLALCVADRKSPVAAKFSDGGEAPTVVLTGPDNAVIGKLVGPAPNVKVHDVEALVSAEMRKQEDVLHSKLEDGRSKAKAGEKQAAVDVFKSVVEQKCLFPRPAKDAAKELKKLGVDDASAMVIPAEPNLDPSFSLKIEKVMTDGLDAENKADYSAAERFYTQAHHMDPADPVPLRYLGEFYRHETGDWDKADLIFKELLSMDADPVSRAVALHGLGKMTIHNGQFKKGLALMEQSVQVYPMAMAYRNLAVYWNSEGDAAKAQEYTKLALEADPKDSFNVIFGAVFLAMNGQTQEALKVAKENEDIMPASYNLAAIYALNGQKDKALALLKRHFYEYERTKSVRAKEMMEARVDRVFDSLIKDPDFLALTADADGRLPMRGMNDNKVDK
jgi:tetratricopeptide (TPR) repeat protein